MSSIVYTEVLSHTVGKDLYMAGDSVGFKSLVVTVDNIPHKPIGGICQPSLFPSRMELEDSSINTTLGCINNVEDEGIYIYIYSNRLTYIFCSL